MNAAVSHLLLVILCLLSPSLLAENLEDIFALARKNDAEWAAKKQKYLADHEKVDQASGSLKPTADLNGTWAKQYYESQTAYLNDTVGTIQNCLNAPLQTIDDFLDFCTHPVTTKDSYQVSMYDVTIAQPLLRMDSWKRYKRAKILDNAAKSDLAYSQQELMIRSAEAYFGVLRAEEELRLTKAEEKVLSTQLIEIKNRYRLGLLRDTDVFELQGQYDIAKAAVIVAQTQVDVVKENMAMLTGSYIELVNPLPKDIPITPPQPNNLADWEDFARKGNYRVISSQFALEASEKELEEKKAGHAPTADLFLRYEHRDVGGGFTPSSDTTTFGVRVNVPLYSGGITSSQVREVNYRLQESRQNMELVRRNALRETRQYFAQVNASVASVDARNQAVKSNASSLRAMKIGWQDGIRSMSDTLASQRKLFQARKEYATSRYDYILNTLKLKKAAGVLTPDDLKTLNSWLDSPTGTVSTVSNLDSEGDQKFNQIDDINVSSEVKTFEDEQNENNQKNDSSEEAPASLFDAFKNWRNAN